ncbi:MAG: hypothetical protein AAFU85_26865, partial [Planctomycetota bacterium]
LSATQLQVRQRLLRSVIIAASVSSIDETGQEDLLRRIARLQGDAERLQQKVEQRRDRLNGTQEGRLRAEHERLARELGIQRISLAVMQTELFPEDSDDFRTASVDAANLARDGVAAFPDNTAAKRMANYWLAVCLLGAGDTETAGRLIRRVRSTSNADGAERWRALAIRLALVTNDIAAAKKLAAEFYGDTIDRAPRSSEMDFARLRILLRETDNGNAVAQWLDAIESRGDAFARRRAEAIAISTMGQASPRPTKMPSASTNPVIVAARGEDLTRRGDLAGGAALLRAAALAERSPDRAIVFATKSAAASLANKDAVATIDVLHSVAMNHFASPQASGLSYAAADHAAKQTDPSVLAELKDRSLDVRSLLQEIYVTWPNGGIYGRRANEWLCEIHTKSGDLKSAAYAAAEFLLLEEQPTAFDRTTTAWFAWVNSLEIENATNELKVFQESLRELFEARPQLQPQIRETAVWLLDQPNSLIGLDPTNMEDRFLRNLSLLRMGESSRLDASGIESDMQKRARWRLVRDGILEPKKQPLLGPTLRGWPQADQWLSARGELWVEVNEKTIANVVLLGLDRKPGRTERAIDLLLETKSDEAIRAAITLADRLVSRFSIGEERWHEWKLKAIAWLHQTGQSAEATKRARYILLTNPPKDPDVKARYEAF